MKRDTAATIFRTVVIAGAMLGAPACGKKPAPAKPTDPAMMKGDDQKPTEAKPDDKKADPTKAQGDPCAGGERPRGTTDEDAKPTGRGFVLS
jgi:hypothetical protein